MKLSLGLLALVVATSEGFASSRDVVVVHPRWIPRQAKQPHVVGRRLQHDTTHQRHHIATTQRGGALKASSSSSDIQSLVKNPIASASLFVLLDIFFRKTFQGLAISFPSSLGVCCTLFATMWAVEPFGKAIFPILQPGAVFLAKWLPVFFVPSLVTLPLAEPIGSSAEILKVLSAIVGGFYFTLLTTAGSVVGIRKLVGGRSAMQTESANVVSQVATKVAAAATPSKPFSDVFMAQLQKSTAVGAVLAVAASRAKISVAGPIASSFLLLATLHNYVFGTRLPKGVTKIVHPLVTCTGLTWAMGMVFGALTGSTFLGVLRSYTRKSLAAMTTGPGDLLLFLLGPSVVSFAMSMYERRKLLQANLKEVGTGIAISSVGGLLGTALAVRLLSIARPTLRLALLSRNITSPLAMAIAGILGADVSLAVSIVVVTGLIGANFGASILDSVGIQDPVARGMGIGAAAHGLGTASFVNEKDAFPFAAISMALTATACTCLVSVPLVKRAVLQLALGV